MHYINNTATKMNHSICMRNESFFSFNITPFFPLVNKFSNNSKKN